MKNDNSPWSFPDVTYFTGDLTTGGVFDSNTIKLHEQIVEMNELLFSKEKEIERNLEEIAGIKREHEAELIALKNLYSELDNRIPTMNAELISITSSVIRNIAKKIIHKELENDAEIIKNILTKLLDQIADEGSILVEICSADYEILKDINFKKTVKFKINDEYKRGDMVILGDSTGYMHRIDDILNSIMSSSHEYSK